MLDATDRLSGLRHLLLTTFDPDGTPVTTATWVVRDGTALGVWAPVDSPTVHHLRRRPRVLVAGCETRGRPLGARLPARAVLCGPDTTARYRSSLLDKYGLTALLALARSRLRLGLDGTVGIRITLTDRYGVLDAPEWRPASSYSLN